MPLKKLTCRKVENSPKTPKFYPFEIKEKSKGYSVSYNQINHFIQGELPNNSGLVRGEKNETLAHQARAETVDIDVNFFNPARF